MAINSRRKGASGEREAAKWLNDNIGGSARRGVQYSGSPDSPDVVFDEAIQLEIKRVERINIDTALEQAKRDGIGKIPVVMHRRNNKPWQFTLYAENLVDFCRRIVEIKSEHSQKKDS